MWHEGIISFSDCCIETIILPKVCTSKGQPLSRLCLTLFLPGETKREFKVWIKTPESKPQITTPDFKVQKLIENKVIKNLLSLGQTDFADWLDLLQLEILELDDHGIITIQ